jgi:hypothetical protein
LINNCKIPATILEVTNCPLFLKTLSFKQYLTKTKWTKMNLFKGNSSWHLTNIEITFNNLFSTLLPLH